MLVFLNSYLSSRYNYPIQKTALRVVSYPRLLDGVLVSDSTETNLRPVAVVIDNSFDARLAEGLSKASLVYETIAEGAITRFLAIYDPNNLPDTIGPVRSLRPYFIDLAQEVDALPIHVGGSPKALERITVVDTINEFYQGEYFWRDETLNAPHNVFTSSELILKAIDKKGFTATTSFSSWNFDEQKEAKATSTVVDSVIIDFSTEPYRVRWLYDSERNLYKRFVNKLPENITAQNIIIQVVPSRVIDRELRREVFNIGEGRAWIFKNGELMIGKWQKLEKGKRTEYFDSTGMPISFNRGVTWIAVIDDEGQVRL